MLDQELLNQLFRFALSLTNDDDQAYDLLQICVEKYLRINQSEVKTPAAYLKRMIRNEFIDQTRKRRFYQDTDPDTLLRINDENSLQAVSLEDVFVQHGEVAALLATMRADERELLYLWAVEEYTLAEIAQMKQVPRGTLLSKLHRLKKHIRLQQHRENVVNLREMP